MQTFFIASNHLSVAGVNDPTIIECKLNELSMVILGGLEPTKNCSDLIYSYIPVSVPTAPTSRCYSGCLTQNDMVETTGFEPVTSTLLVLRSPN